jgi:antitoxin component YwqK of YwqJK toxin-antitoxin module
LSIKLSVKRILVFLAISTCALGLHGQGYTRYTYHDPEKKHVKEVYQVKDTIRNILHGRYISYFLNGVVESKGQFADNETTGNWEFYYETGTLKMRGMLRQNSNYGLWEYFYENGQKSMEGTIVDRNRSGEWKIYYESGELKEQGRYESNKRSGYWKTLFEDGTLRGEIDYEDDNGRYTEYYHSGNVYSVGPRSGSRNVGLWKYYAEDGSTLMSEGEFTNGKRSGEWKTYYPSGKVASSGYYENDVPVGRWNYYFESGTISSSGEYRDGFKQGYWNSFAPDGYTLSETDFNKGSGEYREYYKSGKLKVTGRLADGRREGKWQYFFEDGRTEGECEFSNGKGTYLGYYPSGTLQTKGTIEDEKRVGTWELYEADGTLAGYYKPIYGEQDLERQILKLSAQLPKSASQQKQGRHFSYFRTRSNEYRGTILQANPLYTLLGSFPFGIEFYNQERLGHEFAFIGYRDPFYVADNNVSLGDVYKRGYAISLRQKFYNPVNLGMWYFGHQVKFTNVGHFTNVALAQFPDNVITGGASEQRIEYGVMLGYRLMERNNNRGFTLDASAGFDIGYRSFDADPLFEAYFGSVDQDPLATSWYFLLTFGYCFSFDGRR